MAQSSPSAPTSLWWAPETPIQYSTVNDLRIRYIKTGQGPNLVLLHTLRTQLDIFHKVIPLLSDSLPFTRLTIQDTATPTFPARTTRHSSSPNRWKHSWRIE